MEMAMRELFDLPRVSTLEEMQRLRDAQRVEANRQFDEISVEVAQQERVKAQVLAHAVSQKKMEKQLERELGLSPRKSSARTKVKKGKGKGKAKAKR